jgi:hypothetical protein
MSAVVQMHGVDADQVGLAEHAEAREAGERPLAVCGERVSISWAVSWMWMWMGSSSSSARSADALEAGVGDGVGRVGAIEKPISGWLRQVAGGEPLRR